MMESASERQLSAGEDSAGCSAWPFVPHQFFPSGTRDGWAEVKGSLRSYRLSASFDTPNVSKTSRQGAHQNGGTEATHWNGPWQWNSFSFSAERVPEAGATRDVQNGQKRNTTNWIDLADSMRGSRSYSAAFGSDISGCEGGVSLFQESQEAVLGESCSSPQRDAPESENTLLEDPELLTLKLGGKGYALEGIDGDPAAKRSRPSSVAPQQPRCQVDHCQADMSMAKDYHRRHKVCEVHAKALKAAVAGVMQRFCQQCSRFHLLSDFDEGKKSCRKRLAGHNRRRRKNQPDAPTAQADLLANGDTLASVLRILAQLKGLDVLLNNGNGLLEAWRKASCSIDNSNCKTTATETNPNNCMELKSRPENTNNEPWPVDESGFALSDRAEGVLAPMISNSSLQILPNSGGNDRLAQTMQVPTASSSLYNHMEHLNSEQSLPLSLINSEQFVQTPGSIQPSKLCSIMKHPISDNMSNGTGGKVREVELPGFTQNRSESESDGTVGGDLHAKMLRQKQHGNGREMPADQETYMVLNHAGSQARRTVHAGYHTSSDFGNPPPIEQSSDNALSGSDKSLADSGSESQERTDRIAFKLFDRNPGELPLSLRKEIIEWLAHSPSDMESYIRPGCVILTIFISMAGTVWDKLSKDINGSLTRLIQGESVDFWCRGRILVQLGTDVALIDEGKVHTNKFLKPLCVPQILLVRPFAVVIGESVDLLVKGVNLNISGARMICAYGGDYVDVDLNALSKGQRKRGRTDDQGKVKGKIGVDVHDEQTMSFSVGPFDSLSRCFIEVDCDVIGGKAFPVIVANREICEEIRTLEKNMDNNILTGEPLDEGSGSSHETRPGLEPEVIHFLHELGWLFQRSQWQMSDITSFMGPAVNFSPSRFRWLLNFAVDHSWCAVVNKILDLLFSIGVEPVATIYLKALQTLSEEVSLVHRAVRTNSRPMVEMLLAYSPPHLAGGLMKSQVFSPDAPGPAGLTPLHIAASMHDADGLIDALTNGPGQAWISTWKSACDAMGQTPFMYALAAGNDNYIKLVQTKLERVKLSSDKVSKISGPDSGLLHANLDAATMSYVDHKRNFTEGKTAKQEPPVKPGSSSQLGKLVPDPLPTWNCTCKGLDHLSSARLPYKICGIRGSMYRPFVLSILAIAAVCVCVCLLMNSPPQVVFVRNPFTWESVDFGSF